MPITITSDWIALYAAIIGTGGFVISLFNYLRERRNIKIKINKAMRLEQDNFENIYVLIEVINKSYNDDVISGVFYFTYYDEESIIKNQWYVFRQNDIILNKEIPCGYFQIEKSKLGNKKIHSIIIKDFRGNTYIKYTSKFPTFKKWLFILSFHIKNKNIKRLILPISVTIIILIGWYYFYDILYFIYNYYYNIFLKY